MNGPLCPRSSFSNYQLMPNPVRLHTHTLPSPPPRVPIPGCPKVNPGTTSFHPQMFQRDSLTNKDSLKHKHTNIMPIKINHNFLTPVIWPLLKFPQLYYVFYCLSESRMQIKCTHCSWLIHFRKFYSSPSLSFLTIYSLKKPGRLSHRPSQSLDFAELSFHLPTIPTLYLVQREYAWAHPQAFEFIFILSFAPPLLLLVLKQQIPFNCWFSSTTTFWAPGRQGWWKTKVNETRSLSLSRHNKGHHVNSRWGGDENYLRRP